MRSRRLAGMPRTGARVAIAVLLFITPSAGRAWIYSEHRAIAGAAIGKLPAAERERLQRLWTHARAAMATLYGYLGDRTIPLIVAPIGETSSGPELGVVAVKTVGLSFPAVEWTPFRTFAT